MTTHTKHEKWLAISESSTRIRQPDHIREACQVYAKKLAEHEKMSLAQEIVTTRAAEFCRAYSGVVDLYFGYRQKRIKSGGIRLQREICVTFVVKEKWAVDHQEPEQLLPKYLFAYWHVNGKRELCAVPVDVDDASNYSSIQVDALPAKVKIEPTTGGVPEFGTVTCALQRSIFPDKTFLLSCKHVFNLSGSMYPKNIWGSAVKLPDGSNKIGVTRAVAGKLKNGDNNLDAQLAEATGPHQDLAKALNGIRLLDIANSERDVLQLEKYFIITPNSIIEARPAKIAPSFISYDRPGIREVRHKALIKSLLVDQTTQGGDSGSPVISQRSGGLLLGMHIASTTIDSGESFSFAIPAWHLFSPELYDGTSPGEIWTLLDTDALESEPMLSTDLEHSGSINELGGTLQHLTSNHQFKNSIAWRLTADGVRIADAPPEVTAGPPQTVDRVWRSFAASITRWAIEYAVPIELVIATICTESSGKPDAVRREPGYLSDMATPKKISIGLMQTLLSTAQEALNDNRLDRMALLDPDISIRAGTAYIAKQRPMTGFDPPKVACAYNAGSLRWNNVTTNRWKLRQYPLNTGEHADRFIKWHNDCFRYFLHVEDLPMPSFFRMLR